MALCDDCFLPHGARQHGCHFMPDVRAGETAEGVQVCPAHVRLLFEQLDAVEQAVLSAYVSICVSIRQLMLTHAYELAYSDAARTKFVTWTALG